MSFLYGSIACYAASFGIFSYVYLQANDLGIKVNRFLDDSFNSFDSYVKQIPRPKEQEIEAKVKTII